MDELSQSSFVMLSYYENSDGRRIDYIPEGYDKQLILHLLLPRHLQISRRDQTTAQKSWFASRPHNRSFPSIGPVTLAMQLENIINPLCHSRIIELPQFPAQLPSRLLSFVDLKWICVGFKTLLNL